MVQASENVAEIPLDKITVPSSFLKGTPVLSDLELEEILRAYDQLQPITVVPIGESYKLVSGVHCYKAAKRLEMETVKAVIVKGPREKGGCKRLGDSVEKALLIARYAKLIGVSDRGVGRPGLLSTEQVEKVKEMHRQGKSLRKIAKEVGVSHETVRQYMMKESVPASESSVARLMSVREVAMRLGVSLAFISDCLSVEEAVRKHPSLRKLKKVAHVKKIVELADALQATEERVKAAVNLIVEYKMTPEEAMKTARKAEAH
jgi:transposase